MDNITLNYVSEFFTTGGFISLYTTSDDPKMIESVKEEMELGANARRIVHEMEHYYNKAKEDG